MYFINCSVRRGTPHGNNINTYLLMVPQARAANINRRCATTKRETNKHSQSPKQKKERYYKRSRDFHVKTTARHSAEVHSDGECSGKLHFSFRGGTWTRVTLRHTHTYTYIFSMFCMVLFNIISWACLYICPRKLYCYRNSSSSSSRSQKCCKRAYLCVLAILVVVVFETF